MIQDPHPTELPEPPGRDVPLLLKDGVRELRFVARLGARRLAAQVVDNGAQAPRWVPPLDQVVKLVSEVADGLDSMAVQLVSKDNDYRHMNFRPLSSRGEGPNGIFSASAHDFQRNFYWIFKHLLKQRGCDTVMVKEEALYRAWGALQNRSTFDDAKERSGLSRATGDAAFELAQLTLVLCNSAPLRFHGLSEPILAANKVQGVSDLGLEVVVAAVLSGEIAASSPSTVLRDDLGRALQTAERVAASRLEDFGRAFNAEAPLPALSNEFKFVLRHV